MAAADGRFCSIVPYKKREINNVHMFCVAVCVYSSEYKFINDLLP